MSYIKGGVREFGEGTKKSGKFSVEVQLKCCNGNKKCPWINLKSNLDSLITDYNSHRFAWKPLATTLKQWIVTCLA